MSALVVALLTALPIGGGVRRGYALGARRALGLLAQLCAPLIAGAATTVTMVSLGWFWPCGLLTPIACGIAVAAVARRCLVALPPATAAPRRAERWLGGAVGAGGGACVAAAAWQALAVLAGSPASPAAATPAGWLTSVVETANRGFVRHLPIVGRLGDELEALTTILDTSPEARRRLARQKSWHDLAELPAMRAVLDDQSVHDDIDRLRRGDLLALYRLQRNERVLALFASETIARLARDLRPSELAAQLRRAGD